MEIDDFIDKYLFGGNISNKKVRYIAACTVVFAYVIGTSGLPEETKIILISNMVLAFIPGLIGRNRKIGFGKAYFGSLFFTAIVGSIAALSSERIE
jgi:hypothetical protein